jgi:hypothetical protein
MAGSKVTAVHLVLGSRSTVRDYPSRRRTTGGSFLPYQRCCRLELTSTSSAVIALSGLPPATPPAAAARHQHSGLFGWTRLDQQRHQGMAPPIPAKPCPCSNACFSLPASPVPSLMNGTRRFCPGGGATLPPPRGTI